MKIRVTAISKYSNFQLRDAQNFCTDSECLQDGPQTWPDNSIFLWYVNCFSNSCRRFPILVDLIINKACKVDGHN